TTVLCEGEAAPWCGGSASRSTRQICLAGIVRLKTLLQLRLGSTRNRLYLITARYRPKKIPTGAIVRGMLEPARCDINRQMRIARPTSGEAHDQICDPAFDTGNVCNRAGGSSHGHTSQ